MDKIFNIIVGTAGHIDHGKSSIVKALTNIDPDRLKEEKMRKLTIDLGFAPLILPDGRYVGIIDVPGHEKFIKNMVAGASSIDFVMLVIAADDGIMPQTKEHLEIMQLLGIKDGIVILNKIDLVDKDLILLAREEIKDFLQGTFLQDAPVVEVSPVTGQGLDNLKQTIFSSLNQIRPKVSSNIFRMPIQRVFSKHGHGTVITGVPVSGYLETGDTIEILPGKIKGKVKKIQAYGKEVKQAKIGHSTALNVKDIDYKKIDRGQVVVVPDYLDSTKFISANFHYLASSGRPLPHMSEIRFHSGTLEAIGKIAILGNKKLDPGESGYVQFRLTNPVLVAPGDKFVVRLSSPKITIGGGSIIDIKKKKIKQSNKTALSDLKEMEKTLNHANNKIELLLKKAPGYFLSGTELHKNSQFVEEKFKEMMEQLIQNGSIIKVNNSPAWYSHVSIVEKLQNELFQEIEKYFNKNPYRIYLQKTVLNNKVNIKILDFILDKLIKNKKITIKSGLIAIVDRAIKFTQKKEILLKELESCYSKDLFAPPKFCDLAEMLNKTENEIKPLFEYLCDKKALIKINEDIFFHSQALEKAHDLIIKTLNNTESLTAGEIRNTLNTSRKYIIPLLEYFDTLGITKRQGNIREKGPKFSKK